MCQIMHATRTGKTGEYPSAFPKFKRMCCTKCLKDNKHVVAPICHKNMFNICPSDIIYYHINAHSFPQAVLLEICLLLRNVNVHRANIFSCEWTLLFIYMYYFVLILYTIWKIFMAGIVYIIITVNQ